MNHSKSNDRGKTLSHHDEKSAIVADLRRFCADLVSGTNVGKSGRLTGAFLQHAFFELLESSQGASGKLIRPLLSFWTARALGLNGHDPRLSLVRRIATAVEVMHTASLVLDDIEDGSNERRGKPALHVTFGLPSALNFGTWLFFAATTHLEDRKLVHFANSILRDCHVGQGLDLQYSNPVLAEAVFTAPSRELRSLYRKCVTLKTARLFQFATVAVAKAAAAGKESEGRLFKAMGKLGCAFQILDDVKNFMVSESGAKAFEDLGSSVRNFVVVELLSGFSKHERLRALRSYRENRFGDFVLTHAKLPEAYDRAIRSANRLLAESHTLLLPLFSSAAVREEFELLVSMVLQVFGGSSAAEAGQREIQSALPFL